MRRSPAGRRCGSTDRPRDRRRPRPARTGSAQGAAGIGARPAAIVGNRSPFIGSEREKAKPHGDVRRPGSLLPATKAGRRGTALLPSPAPRRVAVKTSRNHSSGVSPCCGHLDERMFLHIARRLRPVQGNDAEFTARADRRQHRPTDDAPAGSSSRTAGTSSRSVPDGRPSAAAAAAESRRFAAGTLSRPPAADTRVSACICFGRRRADGRGTRPAASRALIMTNGQMA